MPPRSSLELLLCAALIWVCGMTWLVSVFANAPTGYEDYTGFHYKEGRK